MNKMNWRPAMTFAMAACVAMFAMPVAAEGLDKVNTAVDNVLALLRGISIAVVTIAIIWSGYKMAFQHARFADIVPVLGGGLLVGVAAEVARYLISG